MRIIDLSGRTIEVTDLDKAIEQAGHFKQYCHEDTAFKKSDEALKAYWTDLHEKLILLKSKSHEQ